MLDSDRDPRGQSPSRGRDGLTSGCPPAPSGCPPVPPAPPTPAPSAPPPARTRLIWDVRHLVGGAGVSAAMTAATMPLLSRLFTPTDFGVSALFVTYLVLLLTVSTWSYDSSIPLPSDPEVAANCLALSLAVAAVMSCFTTLLVATAITHELVPQLHLMGNLGYLLPVALAGASLYQALSAWALRTGAFETIAKTRVMQTASALAVQCALGTTFAGPTGLIVGDALGRIVGVWAMLKRICRDVPWKEINLSRMIEAAVRYKRFPLFSAPAGVLTASATQLPIILIIGFHGAEAGGVYALTTRILSMPIMLIGKAVGQVVLARAAKANADEGALKHLTEQSTIAMIMLGLLFYGAICIAGPGVFGLTLGEEWVSVGHYSRLLTPWYLMWLVATALNGLLSVREWQPTILMYSSLELVTRGAALTIGSFSDRPITTIALLGAFSFALCVAAINRFFKAGHGSIRAIVRASGRHISILTVLIIVLACYSDSIAPRKGLGLVFAFIMLYAIVEHRLNTLRRTITQA